MTRALSHALISGLLGLLLTSLTPVDARGGGYQAGGARGHGMQRGGGFRKSFRGGVSRHPGAQGGRSGGGLTSRRGPTTWSKSSATLTRSHGNPILFATGSRAARTGVGTRGQFFCCAGSSRKDGRPKQRRGRRSSLRPQPRTFSGSRQTAVAPRQHFGHEGHGQSKGPKAHHGQGLRKRHRGHEGQKRHEVRTAKGRHHFGAVGAIGGVYYVAPASRIYLVEDYVAEEDCRQLTEHGYDADGRRVLVTWTLCTDQQGEHYVPADGRHVVALY